MSQQFKYFHPSRDGEKYLSMGNIIWAERDKGDAYYRTSIYAMKGGKFPSTHPCFPFDAEEQKNSSQIGWSQKLNAFRARGYWASCFPEGDGITLKWWQDVPVESEKNAEQVMQDIKECFGWDVKRGDKQ